MWDANVVYAVDAMRGVRTAESRTPPEGSFRGRSLASEIGRVSRFPQGNRRLPQDVIPSVPARRAQARAAIVSLRRWLHVAEEGGFHGKAEEECGEDWLGETSQRCCDGRASYTCTFRFANGFFTSFWRVPTSGRCRALCGAAAASRHARMQRIAVDIPVCCRADTTTCGSSEMSIGMRVANDGCVVSMDDRKKKRAAEAARSLAALIVVPRDAPWRHRSGGRTVAICE